MYHDFQIRSFSFLPEKRLPEAASWAPHATVYDPSGGFEAAVPVIWTQSEALSGHGKGKLPGPTALHSR